jgi:hypothetical protein
MDFKKGEKVVYLFNEKLEGIEGTVFDFSSNGKLVGVKGESGIGYFFSKSILRQKDIDSLKRYKKAFPNDKRDIQDILFDIKLERMQKKILDLQNEYNR